MRSSTYNNCEHAACVKKKLLFLLELSRQLSPQQPSIARGRGILARFRALILRSKTTSITSSLHSSLLQAEPLLRGRRKA
jgi:hypothetical protein